MPVYDALYARQSVEKTDSISIESQLEYCRFETHGNAYKEYTDRGYSGKNTKRPAFEEMMDDIKNGIISRVIVYKLDRISRSILDFENMIDLFQKYHVEFVSSTEHFDTSTPIGRAMLNICIVFAQLERETIQKRITDAYYSRCRRGFYMGGRIPYGFSKTDTVIDGIRTSMYVPVPEEAAQIRLMYSLYADSGHSLSDIVTHFHEHGILHLRGGSWNTARISDMLRNPVYVKADADVYNFFRSQGTKIINPVSDFTGRNACYLYKGTESSPRKQSDLTDRELVLAPHEGIVSSRDWIRCRLRCLSSRKSARTCKAKHSWLAGKLKCGCCGHSLTIVKADTRRGRYFVCSTSLPGKRKCRRTGGTIYADVLEAYIENAIQKALGEFRFLTGENMYRNPCINENKIRIAEIEEEIRNLISQIGRGSQAVTEHLSSRIELLDTEKHRLMQKNLTLLNSPDPGSGHYITAHTEIWKKMDFEDRKTVADILIREITAADGKISIFWKI